MTCGSTYAHLLVTESGDTPSEPWSWLPTIFGYDEWYDVAHAVGREVFKRWSWLLEIEDGLSKMDAPPVDGPYPERDQLLFLLQDFAKRLEGVKHVLLEQLDLRTQTWEPAIREAIATAQDGTCVLEQLDAATAYYQRPPLPHGPPPIAPEETDDPPREEGTDDDGGLGGVLMTGALAVGAALLWRRHTRKGRR